MRKLLVGLVILAVALFVADFGVRSWAESWVGSRIEESFGLSEKPDVSLHGFPFLLSVATGDISSVSFDAATFRAEDVSFERAHVDLHDVTFPPSKLLSGSRATIRAERGEGVVAMTGAQVSEALSARGVPVRVRFEDDTVTLSADPFPGEVAARAAIEDGVLVLRPADPGVPGTFELPLPQIVPGLRFTGLAIAGSEAILEVQLDDPVFEVQTA